LCKCHKSINRKKPLNYSNNQPKHKKQSDASAEEYEKQNENDLQATHGTVERDVNLKKFCVQNSLISLAITKTSLPFLSLIQIRECL